IPDAGLGEILVGVGAVLACGIVVGLVNAALVRGVKIPSIIATLATMSVLDGIALTLRDTPGGSIDRGFLDWLKASWGPVPIAFVVVVVGAGLLDVWLHGSGSGLRVRSVGFDERAAKRNGIPTTRIKAQGLVLSGLFAALAAFFV